MTRLFPASLHYSCARSAQTVSRDRGQRVNVLVVSRAGSHRATRLQTHQFHVGDVVVLQGWEKSLQTTLADLGLLPLADRRLSFDAKRGIVPLAILAVAMALISLGIVNVAVGFFAAAVIVLLKQITLQEAYASIEGPVLVLLKCANYPTRHRSGKAPPSWRRRRNQARGRPAAGIFSSLRSAGRGLVCCRRCITRVLAAAVR